ncbi:MAG: hypothetical protein R3270_10335 [Gammaproteobacteria bacterium]|nr:hypothetical protein [Gammaproteobacteria bacterium]
MKMSIRNTAFTAISLALLLSACKLEDPVPMTGEFVFEVEYENYAWVYQQNGIFINEHGEVWFYDVAGNSNGEYTGDIGNVGEMIPAATLEEKFSYGAVLLETLPAGELRDRINRIPAASIGAVSEPQSRMADAGRCQFRAYYYHEQRDEYELVLLHQSGDAFRVNNSSAARALTEWLYAMSGPVTGCIAPEFK